MFGEGGDNVVVYDTVSDDSALDIFIITLVMAKEVRDFTASFFHDDFGGGNIAILVLSTGENDGGEIAAGNTNGGSDYAADTTKARFLVELF